MPVPPDDPKDPEGPSNPDGKDGHIHDPLPNQPKGKQMRVVISANAQDVKFADFFGYTLSQTHGVIKFGTLQPETGEFVVHTQIALTPSGMVALSDGLKKNIENARKMGTPPGQKPTMN
jgi:hypothetical protein